MALELDTRFLDRRPPPDLTFGASFSHGLGRDLSKNANNATVQNSATFGNDGGVYLNCDSARKYLLAPEIAAYSVAWDKFSLSCWVYQTSNTVNYNHFMCRERELNWKRSYFFSTIGAGILYSMKGYTNSEQSNKLQSSAFSLSTWNHVAVTFDEALNPQTSRFKFYVNGELKTSIVQYGSSAANDYIGVAPLIFGSANLNGTLDSAFRGRISNPLIWENRILNADEVLAIYNSGRN